MRLKVRMGIVLFSVALCNLSLRVQCCSFGACGDILEDPSWTCSVWSPCRDFLRRKKQNKTRRLMFRNRSWLWHCTSCFICMTQHSKMLDMLSCNSAEAPSNLCKLQRQRGKPSPLRGQSKGKRPNAVKRHACKQLRVTVQVRGWM